MIGIKYAIKIYNENKDDHAWYVTSEGERIHSRTSGLTWEAQKVLNGAIAGPGITARELIEYSDMTTQDVKTGIVELLQYQYITPGPVEDYMLA